MLRNRQLRLEQEKNEEKRARAAKFENIRRIKREIEECQKLVDEQTPSERAANNVLAAVSAIKFKEQNLEDEE